MPRTNPTKADLEAARGRSIPDVLAEGLDEVGLGGADGEGEELRVYAELLRLAGDED